MIFLSLEDRNKWSWMSRSPLKKVTCMYMYLFRASLTVTYYVNKKKQILIKSHGEKLSYNRCKTNILPPSMYTYILFSALWAPSENKSNSQTSPRTVVVHESCTGVSVIKITEAVAFEYHFKRSQLLSVLIPFYADI